MIDDLKSALAQAQAEDRKQISALIAEAIRLAELPDHSDDPFPNSAAPPPG